MTEKLIDLVLQQFVGVDLIIAIVGLLIGWLLWLLIFGKKQERKKLIPRLVFCGFIVLAISIAIFVNHRVIKSANTFKKGQTGVLVLRIAGDDSSNSLQRDLVESLRKELRKVPSTNSIVVLASDEQLDDTKI